MTLFNKADLINTVNEALVEFGRYSYYDKGAHEVLNMNKHINEVKAASVEEVRRIGEVLAEFSEWEHAGPFITALLGDCQNISDDAWDALTEDERVEQWY